MEFVRITDQQARDVLWPVLDADISAVRQEEEMVRERAEVDRLVEDVDRELVAERRAELSRLALDVSDGQWARRMRRRSERAVLRSLPTRLPAARFGEGEEAA
ncbi:MAG: hypothetical protein ACRDRL_27795 [Sciscionella sp.]